MKLVIATKNQGKVKEIKAAFSKLPVEILCLWDFGDVPDAVEDGQTFLENARKKAMFYAEITKCACLADDSGLVVDALHGEPGVYSARYAGEHASDSENNAKLIAELQKTGSVDSAARFCCALAVVFPEGGEINCEAACEGNIIFEARGMNGFGYDPYFYVKSLGKTLAEVSVEEKNKLSHRGKALKIMAERLAGYMKW